MDLTKEQLEKAKNAKNVEELLLLAKENGFALTEEAAKKFFEQWHKEGALADEELDNVAGGSQCIDGTLYSSDPPYRLIVTAGNSCPGYMVDSSNCTIDNGTCYQCYYMKAEGVTMYCTKRTIDDDPYR